MDDPQLKSGKKLGEKSNRRFSGQAHPYLREWFGASRNAQCYSKVENLNFSFYLTVIFLTQISISGTLCSNNIGKSLLPNSIW